jgi:glutathione S-transferase
MELRASSKAVEIHGLEDCPFAWQTRIAACEKGVSFEWLPFDETDPDPRVALHNPEGRTPLLVHGPVILTGAAIISLYLDEEFDGPSLQPNDPRERAANRLLMAELADLRMNELPLPTAATRARVDSGLRTLERELVAGAHRWLGGAYPSLADFELWPTLALLQAKGIPMPVHLPCTATYWDRVQMRASYRDTKPSWAR